ncbi:expansin family protein [Sanghuangporus baumii]|uniref:Expansin family protein n=1 Tax=Sanghuangporus baumii TaxID=108892 RepID=A0A9Q5I486_SANBA|nr:expansin family protein [Sanghuangporus baumii]
MPIRSFSAFQTFTGTFSGAVLLSLCFSPRASALAIDKGTVSQNPTTTHIPLDSTSGFSVLDPVKRDDNGRFTFYETGLGACGGWNNPTDFIVALNEEQWDGGSHCWEKITINYNGKSTQAQIVDLCPGCPRGALDMSPGLFGFLDNPDLGVIYGSWSFGTEQAPPPAPAPAPAPPPPPPPPPVPTPDPQSPQEQPSPVPTPQSQYQAPPEFQPSSTPQLTSTFSTNTTIASLPTTTGIAEEQTENEDSDGVAQDEPTSPFYQHVSDDDATGSDARNFENLNLAMINLALLRSAMMKYGQH